VIFQLTLVQMVMASNRLQLLFLLALATYRHAEIPVFTLMEFWTTLGDQL
jgi:hypothetical protein